MAIVGQNALGKNRFCPPPPAIGVAVVDVTDPADPQVVSTLQNPPGTSAEDVVVYTAPSGPFAGRDIAAAGLQTCQSRFDPQADRGLMLWDVTNPRHPSRSATSGPPRFDDAGGATGQRDRLVLAVAGFALARDSG
jgi:hypothetical protein